MTYINPGKQFEKAIEDSCKKQKIFFDRKKDVYIPPEYRTKIPVVKNKFDCLIYLKPYNLPVELKSTAQKSLSFDEKIIKSHQIKGLLEAEQYDGVIPGFLINFRKYENKTFFLHINDFINYKDNTNKKSLPLSYCEEKGFEINNQIKIKYYFYDIEEAINEITKVYDK